MIHAHMSTNKHIIKVNAYNFTAQKQNKQTILYQYHKPFDCCPWDFTVQTLNNNLSFYLPLVQNLLFYIHILKL